MNTKIDVSQLEKVFYTDLEVAILGLHKVKDEYMVCIVDASHDIYIDSDGSHRPTIENKVDLLGLWVHESNVVGNFTKPTPVDKDIQLDWFYLM